MLTPSIQKIITENVRRGNYLNASASAAGISHLTVNEWKQRGLGKHKTRKSTPALAKFAKALCEAEDECQRRCVGILDENMMGYKITRTELIESGGGTVIDKQGNRVEIAPIQSKKVVITEFRDTKAVIEFLQRRFSKEWSMKEQIDHQHEHQHSGEIVIRSEEDRAIASRIASARLGRATPN